MNDNHLSHSSLTEESISKKTLMPNINQSIECVLFLQHTKQVENAVFDSFYSRIGISNAVFDLRPSSTI